MSKISIVWNSHTIFHYNFYAKTICIVTLHRAKILPKIWNIINSMYEHLFTLKEGLKKKGK